jgi:hypothetical protein
MKGVFQRIGAGPTPVKRAIDRIFAGSGGGFR